MAILTVVQNLFVPNDEMLEKTINSLNSLKQLVENDNTIFKFSGWCIKEEYWDIIEPIINSLNPYTFIKKDKNFGKATNINELLIDIKTPFIFTLDSDIVLKSEIDYYSKFKELFDIENIGIIALDLEVNNCHLYDHQNLKRIHNGHDIFWNFMGNGIAGGCLLISKKAWDEVGGYKVMGVYTGEDGEFFLDVKRKNYFVGLDRSLAVIHPHDNNREYQLWKLHVCNRDSNKVKTDISDIVDEATNRWL